MFAAGVIVVVCAGIVCRMTNKTSAAESGGDAMPVSTVDAGVLPTSRLYFLDLFDEWMQKNIFTFGISSFRANVFLESAEERIAELQFLNAEGTLTEKTAQELIASWRQDLIFSATIAGNEYRRGGRAINLADEITRAMFAGADAIQTEFGESTIGGAEAEENIIAMLLPEDANIPDAVLKTVADDFASEIAQAAMQIKNNFADDAVVGSIFFGRKALLDALEENQKYAQEFYANGNYREALKYYRDCRVILRLAGDRNLALEFSAIVDKNELSDRLARAAKLLLDSGLVDGKELFVEREAILNAYSG